MTKQSIIITAGGIGKRMGTNLPKQFLLIGNKPILWLTIKRFVDYNNKAQIILTLPKDWISYWEELQTKYGSFTHDIVEGGVERYDSIKNALKIATGDVIAVHDGCRPFVSLKTIQTCFNTAINNGAAIPVLDSKESLRYSNEKENKSVVRDNYKTVQTPQCFKAEIINKAYTIPYSHKITDDASLIEEAGFSITLCKGNEENIKITSPMDLKIAQLLAKEEEIE